MISEQLCESREPASEAAKLRALWPRPWRKTIVWVCRTVGAIVRVWISIAIVKMKNTFEHCKNVITFYILYYSSSYIINENCLEILYLT